MRKNPHFVVTPARRGSTGELRAILAAVTLAIAVPVLASEPGEAPPRIVEMLPGFPAVPYVDPAIPDDFVAVLAEPGDRLPGVYWGRKKDVEVHRMGGNVLSRSIINVRVSTNEFQTGPDSFTTSLAELEKSYEEMNFRIVDRPMDTSLGPYPVRTAAVNFAGEPLYLAWMGLNQPEGTTLVFTLLQPGTGRKPSGKDLKMWRALLTRSPLLEKDSRIEVDRARESYAVSFELRLASARRVIAEKRFDDAIESLQPLLKQAEEFGDGDPRLAEVLTLAGGAEFGRGNKEAAAPLLERALEFATAPDAPWIEDLPFIVMTLELIYQSRGDTAKVETLVDRFPEIAGRVVYEKGPPPPVMMHDDSLARINVPSDRWTGETYTSPGGEFRLKVPTLREPLLVQESELAPGVRYVRFLDESRMYSVTSADNTEHLTLEQIAANFSTNDQLKKKDIVPTDHGSELRLFGVADAAYPDVATGGAGEPTAQRLADAWAIFIDDDTIYQLTAGFVVQVNSDDDALMEQLRRLLEELEMGLSVTSRSTAINKE